MTELPPVVEVPPVEPPVTELPPVVEVPPVEPPVTEPPLVVEVPPVEPPRCTAQQIAVAIEVLGGSASIVVRHVWGKPCHLARLPIDLAVWDRSGRRVRLVRSGVAQSGIAGDFSPRFERLIDITYVRDCDYRGPFLAVVNVGPYGARATLSAKEIHCVTRG